MDAAEGLVTALKLIHTTARFLGTPERMARLFVKITTQMVASCRLALNGKDPPGFEDTRSLLLMSLSLACSFIFKSSLRGRRAL